MEDKLESNLENKINPKDTNNIKDTIADRKDTESQTIAKNNDKNVTDDNENNLKQNIENKEVTSEKSLSNKTEIKPKKEIPIEKKPFKEFVNVHLIPSLVDEFKQRGLEIKEINLRNTTRPVVGDKCWMIFCEIEDICNFWLSFENEDISSSKSISLSKPNQEPSIVESFLIDEKRITLKLIISRVLQRLNGQKLIGVN